MQKILFLLLFLTIAPANTTNKVEEPSTPHPVIQVIKKTLQVSGALGFLYGLSRWRVSEKTGQKELDCWISSKSAHLKLTERHQVIFFCGWSPQNTDPNPSQANMYFEKLLPFSPEEINKNVNFYAPGNIFGRRFNSFAQRWDIYQAEQNLRKIIALKKNNQKKTIVFAHCNGASTLIALLFQKPELADELAGIVLYAPYADIADYQIVSRYLPRILYNKPLVKRCIQASIAPNYSCSVKSPVEWIASKSVRKDLPIILVHSDDDPVVPINHSDEIFAAFCENGYQNLTRIACSNKGHFPMDLHPRFATDAPLIEKIRNIIRTQMFELDNAAY
jgi:predicted esterase